MMTQRFAPRARPALTVLALVATMLVSANARADAEGDAKDLFAKGRDLRAKGSCVEAVVLFRKAFAVYPAGLGSARNVAECEEELRHYASARRAWLDVKRALVTTPDPKYQGWDVEAQAAANRLAPMIAKLTIDVVGVRDGREIPRADMTDLVVRVNGEALAPSLVGTELERDPGAYTVQAERGRVVAGSSVYIAQGESRRVKLRIVAERPQPPVSATASDGKGGRRLAGWITLGVGVASLIGAGVSLAVRQSALSDLRTACPGYDAGVACDPSVHGTVDRGRLASTLTNVLGAVGIVATGTGLTLVLVSPAGGKDAAAPPPKSGFTLRPMVGSAGAPSGLFAEWSLL